MYRKYIKRFLDITLSLLSILVLSPLFLIISVIVRIQMGSPILFKQERIGKDEKLFNLYKYRSMTNNKDKNGDLLSEKDRITRFGALLRSSSLDELPELFCILKGDMSFVGPRPMPTYYGPYFFPEERKRHSVRGGLIPPDSLSGKTYTTFEEQFKYEVYYAEHVSFWLDVKVIFTTFKVLFNRVKTGYGSEMDRPHLNVYRNDNNTVDKGV
ncbi:sugar transferase [Clostridium sp.]|uniref:sugar transferase n=1 Tax=Clostridium sp. TaxID=1506 RepID=UPI001DFAB562|nr:sugar transferase [Clostridium sp.]MBS5986934.1 sugar transferase [Clostridium sp.]